MRSETATWLRYAEENLAVCRLSLEKGFLNASMQNAQQCIEKALKAVVIAKGLEFRKTHSIQELAGQLTAAGLAAGISEDECELIDAIYLPSKYPMAAVVPDMEVDADTCGQCRAIAECVLNTVRKLLD
jgi:HEPN domain-containing protein